MKGGRLDGIGKPVSDASTLEKSADLKGVSCVEVICIIWTGSPRNRLKDVENTAPNTRNFPSIDIHVAFVRKSPSWTRTPHS